MERKANSAACVSINTPQKDGAIARKPREHSQKSSQSTSFSLEMHLSCGIIAITRGRKERSQESQTPGPDRRGDAESSAGEDQGSKIPRRRVLRPSRHRAGQIRDAAPRIGRESTGDRRNGGIRRIQADVLSGQGQLRRSGDRRAGAQEAGPTGPAQGAGRSAAVYPGTSGCWQAYSGPSTGQTDSEKISSRYPPEDDRARSKRNLAVKPRSDGLAERLSDVVAQYETLRDAALARALAPEARSGLLIFLRRGLWGWARVLAASRASPPPEPRPLLSFSAGEESRDVIYILAAIAIGAQRRGATP